jgi:hypothetical protein
MDYSTSSQLTGTQAGGIFALFSGVGGIVSLAFVILLLVALWNIFEKAGEAGWKCLIPIYNIIILLKIVGRPWWWLILMLIPLVQIVIAFVVYYDLSKSFGHGLGFAIGLFFLGFIFQLILGFGSSKYIGPGGVAAAPPYTPPTAAPPAPPMAPAS